MRTFVRNAYAWSWVLGVILLCGLSGCNDVLGLGNFYVTCQPLTAQCDGNVPVECNEHGEWQRYPACSKACEHGSCVVPSCFGRQEDCGPEGEENCCRSPVVLGGAFHRYDNAQWPATVSDFRLDRFEVTVGRFRQFVEAYPESKPLVGAGSHPKVPKSGWNAAWEMEFPADQNQLITDLNTACVDIEDPLEEASKTWSEVVSSHENKPINCVSWYIAFAFCAWDGGRLPTEAELNYAASGGSEQRKYPWWSASNAGTVDDTYASYNCPTINGNSCALDDILEVGFKSPKGDGRWHHADLAGSMAEWTLDEAVDSLDGPSCTDCAHVQWEGGHRVLLGGSWRDKEIALQTTFRDNRDSPDASTNIGFRCARDL